MLPKFLDVFKPGTISHLERGEKRELEDQLRRDTVSDVDADSRLSFMKRLQNSWNVPR